MMSEARILIDFPATMASDWNMTSYNITNESTVAGASAIPPDVVSVEWCAWFDFVVEGLLMGVVCCCGIVLNILSIICLAKDKSGSATPFLLISLEVADTLFLVFVLPLRVIHSIAYFAGVTLLQPLYPYMAKFIFPLALICETGSIYMTILVTVNRFLSACFPYKVNSICSLKNSRLHVICVWIAAFLYNMPRFFELEIYQEELADGTTRTKVNHTSLARNELYQHLYCNIMYSIVMFGIPLVALSILNTLLFLELRKIRQKRKVMTSGQRNGDATNRSEHDITLILIMVVLAFVVSNFPALITQILLVNLSNEDQECPASFFYYVRISDFLVVCNSAINFVIYIFCSSRFRNILVATICSARCRHDAMMTSGQEMSVRNGHARQTPSTNAATKYTSLGKVDARNGQTKM